MTTKTQPAISKPVPENKKEKNALVNFRVTIRDREHFYRIVNWLNTNVGKGVDKWTMEGRALKSLKAGKTVSRMIYIYREGVDEAASVYLTLL
jgi:hypothetical protein